MRTAYSGVADVATGEPVTATTRFAVGSLAKSTVATVLALLTADRRLSLDDRVTTHVPELHGCSWAEQATLRDLLANRSRIPLRAELEFSGVGGEGDDVLSRYAAAVGAAEPEPTAGFWSYTNAGWCVLGRAIETATGLAWEDAMTAELFAPFGMDQTTFANRQTTEPRAQSYVVGADGCVAAESWAPRALGPAGSTLLSTASDLIRFAQRHLQDPHLAVLRSPHAGVRIHGWLDAWCLGWARFDWGGVTAWGWDGLISGHRTILRILPDQRAAVVLLTNGSNGRALYRSLFSDLVQTLLGASMPALRLQASSSAAGDLARFAGTYAWPDRSWEVAAAETHLVLTGDEGAVEAVPLGERVFLVDADDPDNPTVTFGAFDADNRPGVLYEMLWGYPRRGVTSRARPAAPGRS